MEARKCGATFSVAESTGGVVTRLLRRHRGRNGENEWIAISRQAAAVGAMLLLEVHEGERPEQLVMCVIESRRVVLDGDTRHWIRLQATDLPPVLFEQQVRRG